ncbi:MAG: winged helix-turn-helix domain-containing protein, partial [Aeromonas sp.]
MKETLPSYEAMMPAVLKVLADGVACPLREVFERVCQHYAFTAQQLADTLPSGRQTTLRSRVGWAKTYLVKAGLIEQPKRGICLITERGKAALMSGLAIDNHYLTQFNEFVAFANVTSENAGNEQPAMATPADTSVPEQASTPQEQIEQALAAINRSLADDLLAEI